MFQKAKNMEYKKFIREGNGASDITPLFKDGPALFNLVSDLNNLFKDLNFDKIACVEGKGFILGSPIAYLRKVGLVQIRSAGKLKNDTFSKSFVDYSKNERILEIHKDAIDKGEKVLIIDDYVETGETIKAAISLIEKCGGEVVGIGSFFDDSSNELKKELEKYNYKYVEKSSKEDKF